MLFSLLLVACSNENTEENQDTFSNAKVGINEGVINEDSIFIIGYEQGSSHTLETTRATNLIRNAPLNATGLNEFTVYGYTTSTTTGNKKVIISQDLADNLGIARQIYVMETLTLKYIVTISGLGSTAFFTPRDSPNCGMDPNNSSVIGYSNSVNISNVVLATKVHHIISDLSGRSYDMWYPRKPADLQWSYGIINLN